MNDLRRSARVKSIERQLPLEHTESTTKDEIIRKTSKTVGKRFKCEKCLSSNVINSRRKKTGQNIRKQSPRYVQEDGKMLVLCNACGLRAMREHARMDKKTPAITVDIQAYMQDTQQFTTSLQHQLQDRDAEVLFCTNLTSKHCACIQNYITQNNDVITNAQLLLSVYKEAKNLSQLKYKQPNESTDKTKVGLGNGKKKSEQYLTFVLEKRSELRQFLCEKACQKLLCYSNNLLYRKLKTENNNSRLGQARSLVPVEEFKSQVCCDSHCLQLALDCPNLITEWRWRCEQGQQEKRRVLAELLTPTQGHRRNCYSFIQLVTGCSYATIAAVAKHLKVTGWDREPPDHGLKKYWQSQQYNVIEQNPVQSNLQVDSTNQQNHTQNQCQLPETSSEPCNWKGKSVKGTTVRIPEDLEQERDEILRMQRILEQEQEKLQLKRNQVENQIMAVLGDRG